MAEIDTIKVPIFGGKVEYLMMVKDNKVYVYTQPISAVQRWTQGSMMGGSRSRQINMYDVKDYGEVESLRYDYRLKDFMERKIQNNEDVNVYDKASFTKSMFRKQYGRY